MSIARRDTLLASLARIADGGFLLGALCALLAFVSVFIRYGPFGPLRVGSWVRFLAYCIAMLIPAAACFAALRLPATQRINLFIVCAVSLVSAFGMELVLELDLLSALKRGKPVMTVLSQSRHKDADAKALETTWRRRIDPSTSMDVLASLHTMGFDVAPVVTPSNHLFTNQPDGSIASSLTVGGRELMPLAGVANKMTLLCNEGGSWIAFPSDDHGFNNPKGLWQSEYLEIAALGDSFTQGYCVQPAENFVSGIRRDHAATLNLGVAGDGPLLELATLREYLPPLRPKVVLWFYFEGNDLTDLMRERTSTILSAYLEHEQFTQHLAPRQADIDRAILAQIPKLGTLMPGYRDRNELDAVSASFVDFAKLSSLRARIGLVGPNEIPFWEREDRDGSNQRALEAVLREAKREVAAWDGRLVFVYLPEWGRYAKSLSVGARQRDAVLRTVGDVGLPMIDLDAAFAATGDPLSLFPFRQTGHYNEQGHQLVADELRKALSLNQN